MRRALVLLLVAALAATVVVVGVLVATGDDEPRDDGPGSPDPSAAATPSEPAPPPDVALAELDTLTTTVRRGDFCDAVPDEAVEAALGGPPAASTSYADGQSAEVTGQVRDIAHEFSCGWTSSSAAARAWVFAPPVTARTATRLVREAREQPGCRPAAGAATFGRPGLALVCRTPRMVQTSYRGLFGDAWLTCTVAGRSATPAEVAEVGERADRWCVAVLAALAP